MNGEDFHLIVQTYICPILAGSVITPQLLAALKNNGQAIHLSPSKNAGYKVR